MTMLDKVAPSDKALRSVLSRNSKTGYSVNVHSCLPTPICKFFCYRHKRTKKQALDIELRCGFNPGTNTGPITWPVQRTAYIRKEGLIKRAAAEGWLEEIAVVLINQMADKEEDLRWCGTGDLFPELCELIALYASLGKRRSFGFSRQPTMLSYLSELLCDMGVPSERWPYFLGSIDESTPRAEIYDLSFETVGITGAASLALATWKTGAELDALMQSLPNNGRDVRVLFGIHSSNKRTILGHPRACPATEGHLIKCVKCRRCYGED